MEERGSRLVRASKDAPSLDAAALEALREELRALSRERQTLSGERVGSVGERTNRRLLTGAGYLIEGVVAVQSRIFRAIESGIGFASRIRGRRD